MVLEGVRGSVTTGDKDEVAVGSAIVVVGDAVMLIGAAESWFAFIWQLSFTQL